MVFNPDCIRDILTECEKSSDGFQELCIEETNIPCSLSKYSWNELFYHLKQCKSANLFDENSGEDILGDFIVNDLSPEGHKLLQQIKSNSTWKKLLKRGVDSLPSLISIAVDIAGLL